MKIVSGNLSLLHMSGAGGENKNTIYLSCISALALLWPSCQLLFPAVLTHNSRVVGSTPTVHVLTVSAWVLVSPRTLDSSHKDTRLHTRLNSRFRLLVGVIVNRDKLDSQPGCWPYLHPKTAGVLDFRRKSDGVDQLIMPAEIGQFG